jgi:predicted HicB family RNase H-like nuclease
MKCIGGGMVKTKFSRKLSVLEKLDEEQKAKDLDMGPQAVVVPPEERAEFKGLIVYRTTPRRHYLLAVEAKRRGRSLSRMIDDYLDTFLLK